MKFTKITTLFALAALHFNIAFADVAEGEKLFTANCVSCHAINEKIVGPALKDVHTRREEKWLVSWIKNSQKMIKSGDPIAVQLNTEYNGLVMTSFEQLSDDNIKSIIAYVKQQSEAPAAPVQAGTTSTDAGGTIASTESQTIYNDTTFIALALMAVILLVVVLQYHFDYVFGMTVRTNRLYPICFNQWNMIRVTVHTSTRTEKNKRFLFIILNMIQKSDCFCYIVVVILGWILDTFSYRNVSGTMHNDVWLKFI
jgi:mono/diheme cytochrome c family protein